MRIQVDLSLRKEREIWSSLLRWACSMPSAYSTKRFWQNSSVVRVLRLRPSFSTTHYCSPFEHSNEYSLLVSLSQIWNFDWISQSFRKLTTRQERMYIQGNLIFGTSIFPFRAGDEINGIWNLLQREFYTQSIRALCC